MMTDNKKKRSITIGQEIQETEKIFQEHVAKDKKYLETKNRDFEKSKSQLDQEITELINQYEGTKKSIVIRAGELLEKRGYPLDKISAKVTSAYKGYIDHGIIYKAFEKHPEWKQSKYVNSGASPNRYNNYSNFDTDKSTSKNTQEPLTKQETEFKQAYEEEVKRNEKIDQLIFYLTGKNLEQRNKITANVEKGQNREKALLDASKPYMFKLSKQMTKTDITLMLEDLRTLKELSDGFGDILYEEQETRKRNDKVLGV